MQTTDQLIDEICKDLAKQQDMEMYVNISDVRRILVNHLTGKLILDRSKVEEIKHICLNYLSIDGAHHKQYALEEIMKIVSPGRTNEDYEKGIPG